MAEVKVKDTKIPEVSNPPFYHPLLWPVKNVWEVISQPENIKVPRLVSMRTYDLVDHITGFISSIRSFLVAYAVVYWIYDEETPYPAWGRGKTLQLEWILPIAVRNVLGCWLICGSWDWFLYFSPWNKKLHKFKMNPVYPSMKQLRHDALWSTIATLCGTGIEVMLCYCWSNGYLLIRHKEMAENVLLYTIMALGVLHMRTPHFYFTHRMQHPWRIQGIPDIGRFLYRLSHNLHHKSYNPTAFSGTSMHYIEATIYYSAALQPAILGLHPVIVVACIVDLAMGAWMGHDGFQWPGSADYAHYLHHKHFDCNYGTPHVPFDHWFGTWAGRKEDICKIWRTNPDEKLVGEEGNETEVHPEGIDGHVE